MVVSVSRILTLLWVVSLAPGGLCSPSKSSTGINVLLPHACDGHGDSRDLVVRYLSGGKLWLNDEALGENVLRARVQADLSRRAEKLLWVTVDEHVLYGEAVGVMAKLSRDNPGVYIALATKTQTGPVDPADPEFKKAELNGKLGIFSLCVQAPGKSGFRQIAPGGSLVERINVT
jgi:biopolymer transport protein ExbD